MKKLLLIPFALALMVGCTTVKVPVSMISKTVPVSLSSYVSLNKNEKFERTSGISDYDSTYSDHEFYYLVLWYLTVTKIQPSGGINPALPEYDINRKPAVKNVVLQAKNKQATVYTIVSYVSVDEITAKFNGDFGYLKIEEEK